VTQCFNSTDFIYYYMHMCVLSHVRGECLLLCTTSHSLLALRKRPLVYFLSSPHRNPYSTPSSLGIGDLWEPTRQQRLDHRGAYTTRGRCGTRRLWTEPPGPDPHPIACMRVGGRAGVRHGARRESGSEGVTDCCVSLPFVCLFVCFFGASAKN